jgi:hypothetical protein
MRLDHAFILQMAAAVMLVTRPDTATRWLQFPDAAATNHPQRFHRAEQQ